MEDVFEKSIEALQTLVVSLKQVIRGRDDTIKLVLTGLIADGHVLIEDYPGSGKTTLAKTLGHSIACEDTEPCIQSELCTQSGNPQILPFRRIQFTPDLLPSDVLGVNVFDPHSGAFSFQHGPVFAHIVLADEINRTGPKVQAAFLECMAERQVTIDNETHRLDDLFFVIGTQNPLDLAGTYPLPLVQLDRFLLKVPMRYVSADVELEILKESDVIKQKTSSVTPVVTRQQILDARAAASRIHISEQILQAIVNIVQASRSNPLLQFGASTRAAIMLKKALGAWVLLEKRDYATEDDLKFLCPYVLMHRLRFHPGAGSPHEAFQEFIRPHIEQLVRSVRR
jgi:MoxR-like ATPase